MEGGSSAVVFQRLSEGDDVSDFNCGHEDTNEFLREDALEYLKRDVAVTYIVKESGKVAGFISLAMGAIKVTGHPRISIPGVDIREYPALKIGGLGVDKKAVNKGLGTLLLQFAMRKALELKEEIGCRFAVDAYPNRIGWYRGRGFGELYSELGKRDTMPMYARTA